MIQTKIDPTSYNTINRYILSIPYIEETEVLNVLISLKNSVAGYNRIPGSLMKQGEQQYLIALTYMINCLILVGYFLEELKLATILHVFKSDN